MRVLFFTETLNPGGAELFVIRLANRISKECETGIVIFYRAQIHPSLSEKLHPSVKIYLIKIPFRWLIQKADVLLRKLGIDKSITQIIIEKQSIKESLCRIISQVAMDINN